MTEEQLSVARKHVDEYCLDTLKYPKVNLHFKTGYIEMLKDAGIENGGRASAGLTFSLPSFPCFTFLAFCVFQRAWI